MSAAESLAHNVPVIASSIGALPEIVQDGINGILVKPGDVQALQNALERVTKQSFTNTASSFLTPAQYCAELEKLYKP